ncbi:PadR family transcriptional regulator [Opitutia bacterium ISCC 51]|jgi:PadR family transcriptional regulator PadR|nr:PadR family transcriptional regulator [Opitutae bacterium ISCC 51]QXD27684.1 PadR family transcriptional regulator [Opitutae bacterium ISCC 52]
MPREGKKDVLLGTLDLLILRVISAGPIHGYGIARRIQQISHDVLTVQQGSLYPALHRLEKKSFIQSDWQTGETKKPIKMYALTKDGEKQLEEEKAHWMNVSMAVNLVLEKA